MIHAMSGTEALQRRRVVRSKGSGIEHWGAEYFGERWPDANARDSGPQSLVAELTANETVPAHFHGLAQFQIFAAGTGKMGRNDLQPLTLQFKDHHTAYGPVISGPQGLTFFAMRMKTANAGPVYLNEPDYRDKLQPSKRRNLVSLAIQFSTEPVLIHRKEVAREPIAPFNDYDDGLAVHLLRLGVGMSVQGPDPSVFAGYYLFVCNGNLDHAGKIYPLWSMVVVQPEDEAMQIKAGDKGLEVLVMEFPKED